MTRRKNPGPWPLAPGPWLLADLNRLTRPQRRRLAWYAAIIAAPLAAVIAAHQLYGPTLARIMGW